VKFDRKGIHAALLKQVFVWIRTERYRNDFVVDTHRCKLWGISVYGLAPQIYAGVSMTDLIFETLSSKGNSDLSRD
jgi:hypothetical protein